MSNISNENADQPSENIASNYIVGAREIARVLGVSTRKVYYFMQLRKQGNQSVPVRIVPGMGLCSTRKLLVDYLNGDRQANS